MSWCIALRCDATHCFLQGLKRSPWLDPEAGELKTEKTEPGIRSAYVQFLDAAQFDDDYSVRRSIRSIRDHFMGPKGTPCTTNYSELVVSRERDKEMDISILVQINLRNHDQSY